MLGRRDFLKLLGLGGTAVVVAPSLLVPGQVPAQLPPPPPLWVPPEPRRRVFQLDQSMLGRPLDEVVRASAWSHGAGTLSIDGVVVATIREWTWDRVVDHGYSDLHQRVHQALRAEVDFTDFSAVSGAYLHGSVVDANVRFNGAEITLKDLYVGDLQYSMEMRGKKLVDTGRVVAEGTYYRVHHGQ